MSEEKKAALAVRLSDDMALGDIFVNSGFFKDTKDRDQAVVKILAGREAGLQPIEAMTGIHIIKEKVTMGSNVMAAAVKKSGRYDYRVVKHTEDECVIDFFEIENGKKDKIGQSSFTMKEAQRIGLTSNNSWRNYPKAMLFARAISAGVRYHCPDVFGHNPVYVPEELGADVDEDGSPIDVTPRDTNQPSEIPEQDDEEAEAVKDEDDEYYCQKCGRKHRPGSSIHTDHMEFRESVMDDIDDDVDEAEEADDDEPCESDTEGELPHLSKNTIDKMSDMTPREAYDTMEKFILMTDQGAMLKEVVVGFIPEYFEKSMSSFQIPESALCVMIETISGLKLKPVEKAKTCKTKGCQNKITEPESIEHEGRCPEHFIPKGAE